REALSTPEERVLSPQANAAVLPAAAPVNSFGKHFLGGFSLSRSTLANIVFVAIASVGGLVFAFYFFNGGEVLRAAASWPSEYLYPRPLAAEQIDIAQQPNPVDQFTRHETSSRQPDQAKTNAEN